MRNTSYIFAFQWNLAANFLGSFPCLSSALSSEVFSITTFKIPLYEVAVVCIVYVCMFVYLGWLWLGLQEPAAAEIHSLEDDFDTCKE